MATNKRKRKAKRAGGSIQGGQGGGGQQSLGGRLRGGQSGKGTGGNQPPGQAGKVHRKGGGGS